VAREIEAVEAGEVDSALRDSSCACPRTQDRSTGRNLVVCIDGTSNQFGKKNTNVIELDLCQALLASII